MLNKNQSKRRNSWKYATVLPLLTIFMLQFQVETVAQEKDSAEKYQETNPYEVKVDKNSTDDYLKLQAEIFKKKHGIDVKFSNVKRNSDKEIVAIKTSYKDKDGNSGNTYQKSDEPIQPFKLTKKEDGIVITGANTTVYGKTKNGESVAITANHIEMPIPPIPPVAPAMPAMPNAPAAPQLPTPPTAPTVGYSEDSKEWKEFEEKMQDFEKEMNSKEGEMAKFEKAMEKFEEEMELAFNKDFEKQMEEFEKKMEIFEVQMEAYTAQLEESLEQNSKK